MDLFKILLIEPELRERRRLRAELERDGYRVVESDSPREGLELLETDSPDLVLMDPDSRDMDRAEAVNRALAHCPRIPVLVSADDRIADDPVRDLADATVSRGADPGFLRDQVRRLLMPDAV